jgi:hypothetical protein
MPFPRDKRQTRAGGRYDSRHKKARAQAAARHHPADPCTRCGQPLGPMNRTLHYDHNQDGTGYLGFAHARCNIRAGSAEGNRRQGNGTHAPPQPHRWNSRAW